MAPKGYVVERVHLLYLTFLEYARQRGRKRLPQIQMRFEGSLSFALTRILCDNQMQVGTTNESHYF